MVEGEESVAVGVPLAGVVTSACKSSACGYGSCEHPLVTACLSLSMWFTSPKRGPYMILKQQVHATHAYSTGHLL